jgi:transcriptional regulator of acetoin/glycerol metabolism
MPPTDRPPPDPDKTDLPRGKPIGDGLQLVVMRGGAVATFPLPRAGSVTLGRAPPCEIVIDDPSMSRRHARIHLGPVVQFEDLGSSNGTSIGSVALAPRTLVPLLPGAVVTMGDVVVLLGGGPGPRAEAGAPAGSVPDGAMDRLYRLVDLIAASPINVLVTGETGAGKEVVAEAIHRRSPRAARPLVKLHCAALPDHLLESELFGFEKGAFTGATAPKMGLLESAQGGTVFLDEIGDMPLTTQVKLLRVIESREVHRLGALKPRAVDVRFIAATHRDLRAATADGGFRQDLYFRLNGITLTVPPLRERPADIEALAVKFAHDAFDAVARARVPLSADAVALLRAHAWPGNVRELKNVVERAVALTRGPAIGARELMLDGAADPPPERGGEAGSERARILEALAACAGNQTEAAKRLGIARRTLVNRIEALGIPRPRKQ